MTTRVGIWEESTWERPGSRRGGGGVERGGDACIALGGSTLPGLGDASIPTPLHTAPAPTRTRPLPMGFLPNTYPCGRPSGITLCRSVLRACQPYYRSRARYGAGNPAW